MARAVREDEIQTLRDKGVTDIIIAMDNDLAGQAGGKTREQLEREWRQEKGFDPPQQGAGDKSESLLKRAGFAVTKLKWPIFAPPKADLGWLLMNAGMTL